MNTIELKPACKDYLWGGEKLRDNYGIDSPLHPLAEAWMLSCHPDGPSMVASGPHAGKTFPAYIEAVGRGCLGADCEAFSDFPILIKLIDAKGDLSIQVHPSGTIHAIRKGILVAEIQENSNVTYRVYDYGRTGADGKPRQLHLDQALEVTNLTPPPASPDFGGHLAQCRYFTVDKQTGSFEGMCDGRSFTSLLVVEGEGAFCEGGETMPIRKGQSLFIPAGTGAYSVTGSSLQCLVTRV